MDLNPLLEKNTKLYCYILYIIFLPENPNNSCTDFAVSTLKSNPDRNKLFEIKILVITSSARVRSSVWECVWSEIIRTVQKTAAVY